MIRENLSDPMKRALLMIGALYYLQNIRWDTYGALVRRGLIVREARSNKKVIGLTDEGMKAYWDTLDELRGRRR
ncbi:MAG TPA: hypothetical protein VMW79_10775 [Anaerolineae bacterium]|nr:hypothetical protein [Anaerolineae bacterium]